jgi:hypothetical protein
MRIPARESGQYKYDTDALPSVPSKRCGVLCWPLLSCEAHSLRWTQLFPHEVCGTYPLTRLVLLQLEAKLIHENSYQPTVLSMGQQLGQIRRQKNLCRLQLPNLYGVVSPKRIFNES